MLTYRSFAIGTISNASFANTDELGKKQHRRALHLSGVLPIRALLARHIYLTRLGAAGCDAWTFTRVVEHSTITMFSRYVHPDADAVNVFARMEAKEALRSVTVRSVK